MTNAFTTTLLRDDAVDATGIVVPPEVIEGLGTSKRPAVIVTIGGYSYRSTVAVMGGQFLIPFSQQHRANSGIEPGTEVTVSLELDTTPRTVEILPTSPSRSRPGRVSGQPSTASRTRPARNMCAPSRTPRRLPPASGASAESSSRSRQAATGRVDGLPSRLAATVYRPPVGRSDPGGNRKETGCSSSQRRSCLVTRWWRSVACASGWSCAAGGSVPTSWPRSGRLVAVRIHEYTALLESTRNQAVARLVEHAEALGANAIVSMRFDSSEMGSTMSEIVAYGTAAIVTPESSGGASGSAVSGSSVVGSAVPGAQTPWG